MQNYFRANRVVFYVLGLVGFLVFFYILFLSAPKNIQHRVFNIEKGMSLRSVSLKLKQENIIRSRLAFEAFIIIYGGEKHIIPINYLFDIRSPVFEVARRIVKGESHIPPTFVTIPEGFDVNQIADTFVLKLENFNKTQFLLEAKDKEGYLFPDTYFFLNTANEQDILKSISKNFEKKITPLLPEILSSGRTQKEIIIMASVIEREARGEEDRGFISGILWKRFDIGMPLQADAAPETYKRRGLPESPISNPGIKAILVAIYPKTSPYLYYLHDREGNIHYAKNFEEHIKNKSRYLR